MRYIPLSWREYILSPEKIAQIPMTSPFADEHFDKPNPVNKYVHWVRALRGGASGVYWYGWQPSDDEPPLFYVGRSVGNLYTTFTRHFSGVYSPVYGVHVPRSIVPHDRHHTVQAGVILTTMEGAPILESRLIHGWAPSVYLENKRANGVYEFSDFDVAQITVTDIGRAQRYLKYLAVIHGKQITRSRLYRSVQLRIAELEFVPF